MLSKWRFNRINRTEQNKTKQNKTKESKIKQDKINQSIKQIKTTQQH